VTERIGDWIQTASGRPFWPLDPRAEEIDIFDIAHSLSNLCRFNGHCSRFYSVAEHSVLVSLVVPPADALAGLLHDATEAYCADVPRPLKPFLKGYADIEAGIWRAVAARFGLAEELPPSVKLADNTVLLAEKAALLGPSPMPWAWAKDIVPAPVPILCGLPTHAKRFFIERFMDLTEGRFQ